MLCPSHVFSLTLSLIECISDTRTHTPSVMVSASKSLPVTCCPFKSLSQSHIPSVTLTQKHSPVRVVNSLETHSIIHSLSFIVLSLSVSHTLFDIVITILCRSHHSDPTEVWCLMEHCSHHSFQKGNNQNAQNFESVVLGREWVCVISLQESCIMGDRRLTWQCEVK